MHYIIHCLDKPDGLPFAWPITMRKAYLAKASIRILVSGPLVADDGETMIGSCFLVEAASKDEVLAFHNGDPFKAAGMWEHVTSIRS